ncbi:hypothetical protein FRIGORI9N_50025 [Frigoribacterium sp. 9N]|nr:hypothetical protein FRIGORI9N_50025 [Frigoribacterium sp. 9N]
MQGDDRAGPSPWPRPPRSDHPSQSHEWLTKRHFDVENTRQKHSTPSFGPIAAGSTATGRAALPLSTKGFHG